MARAAVQRRLTWLRARVLDNRAETPRVHRLILDVPGWSGHLPGQHLDLRLTADDGYTAQRSYSIASPPEEPLLHLLIGRTDNGEVSPYLTDEAQPDDVFELRGPIGGYFVWSSAADRAGTDDGLRPVQMIAGGTGIAPFVAMLAHHRHVGSGTRVHLLYSARSPRDVVAPDLFGAETTITLTREAPPDWPGETGRIDADKLAKCAFPPDARPRIFVCGPTVLVESIAGALVDLGHDPSSIRMERFGGTGESS